MSQRSRVRNMWANWEKGEPAMQTMRSGHLDRSTGRTNLSWFAAVVLLGVCFLGNNADAASSPTAAQVLVVYNTNWTGDADGDGVQDSLQVANYYVAKRGVPAGNVLGVACSTGGSG